MYSLQFATIHPYPDNWGFSPNGDYKWLEDNFFKDRTNVATSLGKPIIMSEYGARLVPGKENGHLTLIYQLRTYINQIFGINP